MFDNENWWNIDCNSLKKQTFLIWRERAIRQGENVFWAENNWNYSFTNYRFQSELAVLRIFPARSPNEIENENVFVDRNNYIKQVWKII